MKDNPQSNIIKKVKSVNSLSSPRYCIPVYNFNLETIATLIPISKYTLENYRVASLLTKWRKEAAEFFFTKFPVTRTKTYDWIKDVVVPSADRILFLISTQPNEYVGHFGVCDITSEHAELDNVIRGEVVDAKRLMFYVELAIVSWIFWVLKCDRVYGNLFSNNNRIMDIHRAVGFETVGIFEINQSKENEDGSEIVKYSRGNLVSAGEMLDDIRYWKQIVLTKKSFIQREWAMKNYKNMLIKKFNDTKEG